MTRPLAAVTGATGFLGAHLVRALHQAGFAVRALARRDPSAPGWGDEAPEVIPGTLDDEAALARLVDGAEVVVHAAGAIKAANRQAFMAVNRDGTARLAGLAGGARFLLVSSLAARHPEVSAYAASKRAGEDAAAGLIAPERLTIVRPPAIYGPGDRETLAIFKAAAASPFLPVLSGDARLALVHVEDAAAAVAGLAQAGAPGVWALADERPAGYGWREILAAAAEAVGRRPALPDTPAWLLPSLCRLGAAAGLVSPAKVGELLHKDWSVAHDELAPDIPAPRFGLKEGFASSVAWYRQAGWLR